jgi:hypothetical protein
MDKKEVQKRVLQNGKPLALSKFSWDKKTNTFCSNEENLFIDFNVLSVNVTTGSCSTVTTGSCSTVTTGDCSTVKTGDCSTVTTGGCSTVTTGSYSTVTTGDCSTVTTGSYSTVTTGDYSTVKTGYDSTVTTGDCSTVTTGGCSTVTTGRDSTVTTGSCSTVKTGDCSTVKTRWNSTVKTGSNSSVVIFNDLPVQTVICDNNTIQTAPYNIKGYIKDGIYSETGKPAIICDGILSEVISQKGNVYKVINYGQGKESYIVKDGDIYSHGNTLEQAKDSLIYKISNRDTTPYKDWKLSDVKTKEELIKAYRVITGACESGTKYFCENTNIPDKCTVEEAIRLTKGQYNSDKFKEFFKGRK